MEFPRFRAHIQAMAISRKFWWNAAACVVGAPMLVLLAYGWFRFPDGSISEYQGGYRSSRGFSHTAEEYRDYKSWEKTLLIVWPLGLAIGFVLQRTRNSYMPDERREKTHSDWRRPRLWR
jgi:hypothetical protein